jgi:DNA-directed RNA polymerase subunit F
MSRKTIDEKILSVPEVKKIMENFKKKVIDSGVTEELSHFQQITLDYVTKFSKFSEKQAKEIIKILIENYSIEDVFAVDVVNNDPQTIAELKVIFEKAEEGKNFDSEKLQEILYKISEIKSK